MIIILNSATEICFLTFVDGNTRLDYQWLANRQLARGVHAFLFTKLAESNYDVNDIEGLGVYRGPGSFTGLRIGIAVMNTLADSLSVPIIGGVGGGWQDDIIRAIKNQQNDKLVLPFYNTEVIATPPSNNLLFTQ